MKLYLDQGVSRLTVPLLVRPGVEVVHAGALGMAKASDDEVLDWCLARGYVVVAFDSDFHKLLAAREAVGPSSIRIRQDKLRESALAELILAILGRFSAQLEQGAVVTARRQSIGCRMLPLNVPRKP